jgi:hypothetical protein
MNVFWVGKAEQQEMEEKNTRRENKGKNEKEQLMPNGDDFAVNSEGFGCCENVGIKLCADEDEAMRMELSFVWL